MNHDTKLSWSYVLTASLLIVHQIDAAYWHEWAMFQVAGGIQGNLMMNLAIVLGLLFAFMRLVQGRRSGVVGSLVVGVVGMLILPIHGLFFALGYPEFRLPMSIIVMIVLFLLALLQTILSIQALRGSNQVTHPSP